MNDVILKLTDVKYFPFLDPETKRITTGPKGLKGFASCILNDSIFLGGIAVYMKAIYIESVHMKTVGVDTYDTHIESLRLVFPSRKSKTGKEFEIFFPLRRDVYDTFLKAIREQVIIYDRGGTIL